MKHAAIITHGPMGTAIIEAVRNIIGIDEGLHALSVSDMSLEEIEQRLMSIVNAPQEHQDGLIIMACLKGGSTWNVSAGIAMNYSNVRVISGVNLPMMLSFVTKRDAYDLDQLVDELVNDGLRGITTLK